MNARRFYVVDPSDDTVASKKVRSWWSAVLAAFYAIDSNLFEAVDVIVEGGGETWRLARLHRDGELQLSRRGARFVVLHKHEMTAQRAPMVH